MKSLILSLITIISTASLANLRVASQAGAQPAQAFGANRRYVAERYEVVRSKTPQAIPNLPHYPGTCVLLSSLKMPHTPGGVTYNERYMTAESPEKVLAFFKTSLASGQWHSQQSGWSINAEDSSKNLCRVHVISQDRSTEVPSTRFIIEYKEHAK